MSESLLEELEAVEAILMEPVTLEEDHEEPDDCDDDNDDDSSGRANAVATPWRIKLQLHPLTASDEDKKFVSLALELKFSKEYPDREPVIAIREPRGLLESAVSGLEESLREKATAFVGSPMLFELIDQCREFLTERNVPACACAICLLNIVDEDSFVKTSCYHYFHSRCMGLYVTAMEKNHQEYLVANPLVPGSNENRDLILTCPVCREPLLEVRTSSWLEASAPVLEGEVPVDASQVITPELKDLQKKMGKLFLKQKKKGAIIDIEAEEKRFLVTTGSAEDQSPTTETPQPVVHLQSEKPLAQDVTRAKSSRGTWKKKGLHQHHHQPAGNLQEQSIEQQDDEDDQRRGGQSRAHKHSRHQRGPKGKYAQHHQHGRRRGTCGLGSSNSSEVKSKDKDVKNQSS